MSVEIAGIRKKVSDLLAFAPARRVTTYHLAGDLLSQVHRTYPHSAGRSASRMYVTLSLSAGWPTRRNPAARPSIRLFFDRM